MTSSKTLWKSVVKVRSSDDGTVHGTGFVIGHGSNGTFVLTCAHTIEKILKKDSGLVVNGIPSNLIKIGDSKNLDIALLLTSTIIDKPFLSIYSVKNDSVFGYTFGYRRSGAFDVSLLGMLLEVDIENRTSTWGKDIEVEIKRINVRNGDSLTFGYSGAPVIDNDGNVLGIISHKFSDSRSGTMILTNNIVSFLESENIDVNYINGSAIVEFDNKVDKKVESLRKQGTNKKPKRKSVDEPPKRLIQDLINGKVIPFVGAGLSISALSNSKNPYRMPNYEELLLLLIEDTKKDLVNSDDRYGLIESALDLINKGQMDVATKLIVEGIIKDDFEFLRKIRKILRPLDQDIKPSQAHNFLRSLDFRFLITTNYDTLLENFVGTDSHDVITPSDNDAFKMLSQDINDESSLDKYILKLHGDISRPETISFGEEKLTTIYTPYVGNLFYSFITELFKNKVLLFLGCSFDPEKNEGQIKLLRDSLKTIYNGRPLQKHYALVESRPDLKSWREGVSRETGIQFIEYTPDDKHTQVWEFISYLNQGKKDEPIIGREWSQWYRGSERGDYLLRQLEFEKKAKSIRFLTANLTNAITTREHLQITAAKQLESQDYDPDYVKSIIIPAMINRFENLEGRLEEEDLEVRAMFLQSSVDRDFIEKDKITIDRYKHLVDLLENDAFDVEIRLLPNIFEEFMKEREASYAVIFSDKPKPYSDVAVAYASQATTDYFKIHTIQQNTSEANKKIVQFERYWASAMSEQESKDYIIKLLQDA